MKKKILALTLSFGILASASACNFLPDSSNLPNGSDASGSSSSSSSSRPVSSGNRDFKNIIVVIGDGMGENHILNAIDYFGLDTPAFLEDQQGYLSTRSANSVVTDSAAGATALATGYKVNNGNVAMLAGEKLTQITTLAREEGMKTGVVTTDSLSGATPAGFTAFAGNRNATATIIQEQAQSQVDLLLGKFDSAYLSSQNLSLFAENGYTVASSKTELFEAANSKKLVGVLPEIGSEYIAGNEENYQLKNMTQFAIEYLENRDGFFLMVEGAYIDKYSHNNSFENAMCEVRSLIDTIELLYEYASDGETAIFITADHETGGLQRATSTAELTKNLYTTTNHTRTNVPLYVKNYPFDPTQFDFEEGKTPENTVVFQACRSILWD